MLKRPVAHPALTIVRVSVTFLIAIHIFISAWLVATVDASYTEGRPSPTEIHSIVAIDKDRTLIDVEIERATSLLLYTLTRDDVTIENQSSSQQNENNSQSENNDQGDSPSQSNQVDWLNLGRTLVKLSLALLVCSELLFFTKLKGVRWLRLTCFLFVVFTLFVAFPSSYIMDLGGYQTGSSGDDFDDSAVENTPGNELEVTQFAHASDYSDPGLVWLGFQLETGFSGYDLGLVEPENRSSVLASIPESGSEDAKSFISFEAIFSIQYGKNLDSIFILPLLWFILPSVNHKSSSEEE